MADPVNITPPTIVGGSSPPVVGETVSIDDGTWDQEVSVTYQWLRETGINTFAYANIPGSVSRVYRYVVGDTQRRIACDVDAESVVVVPTGGTPWLGWSTPSIPGGATVISSASQLLDAFANPVDDAVYDATGLSHTFTNVVLITGRCSSGHEATFFLGNNVIFGGSVLSTDTSVDLKGPQNLIIYDGQVTNPTKGYGMILRGNGGSPAQNVTWWGFKIHDVAMTGILAHQNSGNVQGCDFRGEIWRWCRVPALDPHTTKGSGLHAAYIGVTGAGSVNTSLFVLDVHDCEYGGGVQLGPNLTNVQVQSQAARLTYNPPSGADGTGGNPVQIFGGGQSNLVVSYVFGDVVRRGVETSGMGTPANTINVTYGRVTNTRVSPTYEPHSLITYSDCS